MKTPNQLLSAIAKQHVKPLTLAERNDRFEREHQAHLQKINDNYSASRIQVALGCSGIAKKHQKCRFDNYLIESPEQHRAQQQAKLWLKGHLRGDQGGFIFAGTPGTGKNHLASAIANHIIANKGTAMIVTVSDLMMKMRDTYRSDTQMTEAKLMRHLAKLDLLVIDEVGVQRGNANETITLNEIINARNADEKPTGILTNLNQTKLHDTLGDRAIDRIMEGAGRWVSFNWESYRKRSNTQNNNGRAA
ncbi:ATP-binding protein [Veronia pacifica]|nr:ATP-binding protein [Veronia pacifica]